jgi:hypothetical protein
VLGAKDQLTVKGCTFTRNVARAGMGGGIFAQSGALAVSDSVFKLNGDNYSGGANAIHGIHCASLAITGCKFYGIKQGAWTISLQRNPFTVIPAFTPTIDRCLFDAAQLLPEEASEPASGIFHIWAFDDGTDVTVTRSAFVNAGPPLGITELVYAGVRAWGQGVTRESGRGGGPPHDGRLPALLHYSPRTAARPPASHQPPATHQSLATSHKFVRPKPAQA